MSTRASDLDEELLVSRGIRLHHPRTEGHPNHSCLGMLSDEQRPVSVYHIFVGAGSCGWKKKRGIAKLSRNQNAHPAQPCRQTSPLPQHLFERLSRQHNILGRSLSRPCGIDQTKWNGAYLMASLAKAGEPGSDSREVATARVRHVPIA